MLDEKWEKIPINPYCEKYDISSCGRIRSHYSSPAKILKLALRAEYMGVQLNYNGKGKTYSIHRLVALTFIPNPDNKEVVNHKNGNKVDNRIENLEWVTTKENIAHATKNSLRINKTLRVSQYTLENVLIKTYESIKQAMIETGTRNTRISQVCKGTRNHSGGYIWKYTDFVWVDTPVPEGKPFRDYTNYLVTKEGNVYSKSHRKFMASRSNSGYEYVTLSNNGKIKNYAIHQLVAELYVENPNNLPYVNHKNYNRSDNNSDNLEWCSPSQNMVHFGIKNSTKIAQYDGKTLVKIYNSIKNASLQTGISSSNITMACKNRQKIAGKYIWKYVTKDIISC